MYSWFSKLREEGLTGAGLKWIAIVSMLLDHAGVVFFRNSTHPVLFLMLRVAGRLSFPLYSFLLVESFFHTSNRKKYAFSLLLFALISEIPFDLAASGTWMNPSSQNVFFTLFLGFLAIWGTELLEASGMTWQRFLPVCALSLISLLINSDYAFCGVILIVLIWMKHPTVNSENDRLDGSKDKKAFFSRQEIRRFLPIACLLLAFGELDTLCVLAVPLMMLYNGQRGKIRRKYLYYWIYPLHLLIYAGIYAMLLRYPVS